MSYQRIGESINLKEIKKLSKLSEGSLLQKFTRDQQLAKILSGSDARLLMVMGPCSAHDEEAVVEYGRRLAKLQKEVEEKIFFVMRVYTNKPRTIGDGYKGMLHSSASTPEEVNIFQGVKKV
ncbi:MAG: 3-deoxy-7-phosphoheptulonate synthase, partial [Streptococcaceae bacterium]|nr:3-deoxy-7-phosphoheptulonate synthase [Streptococcaceae bacterium]